LRLESLPTPGRQIPSKVASSPPGVTGRARQARSKAVVIGSFTERPEIVLLPTQGVFETLAVSANRGEEEFAPVGVAVSSFSGDGSGPVDLPPAESVDCWRSVGAGEIGGSAVRNLEARDSRLRGFGTISSSDVVANAITSADIASDAVKGAEIGSITAVDLEYEGSYEGSCPDLSLSRGRGAPGSGSEPRLVDCDDLRDCASSSGTSCGTNNACCANLAVTPIRNVSAFDDDVNGSEANVVCFGTNRSDPLASRFRPCGRSPAVRSG
jgi:hypothetical protein